MKHDTLFLIPTWKTRILSTNQQSLEFSFLSFLVSRLSFLCSRQSKYVGKKGRKKNCGYLQSSFNKAFELSRTIWKLVFLQWSMGSEVTRIGVWFQINFRLNYIFGPFTIGHVRFWFLKLFSCTFGSLFFKCCKFSHFIRCMLIFQWFI